MSCEEFEKIVIDLSSGPSDQFLEDSIRSKGLRHAAECERCGSRLSNERALTDGLRTLAASESRMEASPHLKTALLASFASLNHGSTNVVPFRSRRRLSVYATLAAAAAVLIAFAMFLPYWRQSPSQALSEQAALSPQTNETQVATTSATSDSLPTESRSSNPSSSASKPRSSGSRANRKSAKRKTATEPSLDSAEEVASTEVRTEFIPITYMNAATAMDSGVVVRVEVAREKLAALGLPLNLERAGETIQADIVVGDDGVARAIRLVQPLP